MAVERFSSRCLGVDVMLSHIHQLQLSACMHENSAHRKTAPIMSGNMPFPVHTSLVSAAFQHLVDLCSLV